MNEYSHSYTFSAHMQVLYIFVQKICTHQVSALFKGPIKTVKLKVKYSLPMFLTIMCF